MRRKIVYLPIDKLRANERNAKGHDVIDLAQSFERFGFVEAIIRDDRTKLLVAGHGRLETLTAMHADGQGPPAEVLTRGGKWYVPVQVGWRSKDDDEASAFMIAANRLTETGGWDDEALVHILDDLAVGSRGLLGVGYDDAALDDLRARLEEAAHEDASEQTSDEFRAKQVRSLILEFSIEDFDELTKLAARARHVFAVDSNAELFLELLRFR